MINGNQFYMYPYKKHYLIQNDQQAKLSDKQIALENYLLAGYTLAYGGSSGAINLSSKAKGNYLVVWPTSAPPTGLQLVTSSQTLKSSTGGTHTSVVIMGIELSTGKVIERDTDVIAFKLNSGLNANVLKFDYTNINFSTQMSTYPITNLKVANSNISGVYGLSRYKQFYNNTISESTKSAALRFECTSLGQSSNFWNNNLKTRSSYSLYFSYSASTGIKLKNWQIEATTSTGAGSPTISFLSSASVAKKVDFENVGITGGRLSFGYLYQANSQPVYISKIYRITDLSNYRTLPLTTDMVFNDLSRYRLNSTGISWTGFKALAADFQTEYYNDRSLFYSQVTRAFYNVSFKNNINVDDDLKKFGEGYYFVVDRRDFSTDLASKTITKYNLSTDFESDENFIIQAHDSTAYGSNTVFFGYVDNIIYPTVFTEMYDSRTYTIDRCFQIWEVESKSGLSNLYREVGKNKAITNSPMGGSIRFNNLDNEIIWRK